MKKNQRGKKQLTTPQTSSERHKGKRPLNLSPPYKQKKKTPEGHEWGTQNPAKS